MHIGQVKYTYKGGAVMKRTVVMLFFIVSGCSFFVSRGMHDVIQTLDDFTLLRVTKESDAANTKKLLSGDVSLFVEFGADSCLVAEFSRGRETYTVEMVSFSKPKGALGAYSITDIPESNPFDLGLHAQKSDKVLQFMKGNNIVSVFPSRSGNMSGVKELAHGLEKRIRRSAIKPDIYEGLPQTSMVEKSGLYFMGTKVFQERFSYELAEALNMEKAIEGIAAKYQADDGIVDLIKIRYPDLEHVLEVINSYLKSRSDRPVILPQETLALYTIVAPDRTEVYIAERADWLFIMLGSSTSGKGQEFFEYIVRGGK